MNSTEAVQTSRPVTRLGNKDQVKQVKTTIKQKGGQVVEEVDAGTVVGIVGRTVVFRAMNKGGGAWICMYYGEGWVF